MSVVEWYFGFQPRHFDDWFGFLGHVEAWGYTEDETWVFMDPTREGVKTTITHRHDEILDLMAARFARSDTVIRISREQTKCLPPLAPLTCVTWCGHLVGLRAFTISGFQRKLLQNGGEIIHEKRWRKFIGKTGKEAGAAPGPT